MALQVCEPALPSVQARAPQAKGTTCMQEHLKRPALLIAITAAAFAATAVTAVAATTALTINPGPIAITPGTYWANVKLTCATADTPCKGVLSVETAAAIKPYPTRPKAKAKVADVPYTVPPATTRSVRVRVYGPALAQALKTHAVILKMTAWDPNSTAPVGTRTATFTLESR
jgi:hypothetical protein